MASLPATSLPAAITAAPAPVQDYAGLLSKGRARARCPHCRSAANCRSNKEITATFHHLFYECTNILCGHAWRTSESYDHGLRPSAIPDPALDLPLRLPSRQDVLELMRERDPAQPELFDASPSAIEPGEDPDSGCG